MPTRTGVRSESPSSPSSCASPILRPENSFDVGAVAGILRAMRHVVRMVVAVRFALSTRRDLLLEILALRHQLHVLVRSNRRFRPSDRLLWLVLRQVWPRWTDALVLSSLPRSTVGIARGSIDAGAAARDVLA